MFAYIKLLQIIYAATNSSRNRLLLKLCVEDVNTGVDTTDVINRNSVIEM